jgi:hypothetical protein
MACLATLLPCAAHKRWPRPLADHPWEVGLGGNELDRLVNYFWHAYLNFFFLPAARAGLTNDTDYVILASWLLFLTPSLLSSFNLFDFANTP